MSKDFVGLVRVSDMGERKRYREDFHSEDDQVAAIEHATPKGATVEFPWEPELDVSGGLPLEQREPLRRAVEGAERGDYAGIIVAYQSRLTRNPEVLEEVMNRVAAAGGVVLTREGELRWKTARDRMATRILANVDANGREEKGEQFDELRRKCTARGVYMAARPPRGYRTEGKPPRLVPSTARGHQLTRKVTGDDDAPKRVPVYPAAEVAGAFEAIARGGDENTVSKVARRLGMSTPGLRALLRNRTYLGELRQGKHENPHAHEPLITVELFEDVQAKLAGNPRPTRAGNPAALLAGLVRCSSCGHVMTRGGGGSGLVYRCRARHSGEHCPRPAAIRVDPLESYVEEVALRRIRRLVAEGTPGRDLADAEQTLRDAERERMEFAATASVTLLGAEAYTFAANMKTEAVENAKGELRKLRTLSPSLPVGGRGPEVWTDLDPYERNTLLRALLAAVVVAPVGSGHRVPVEDRTRVLAAGTSWLDLPKRSGHGGGIVLIPLPDLSAPGVLA
jgi:site-specific DNA recombinase